jgi:hypothetical protein
MRRGSTVLLGLVATEELGVFGPAQPKKMAAVRLNIAIFAVRDVSILIGPSPLVRVLFFFATSCYVQPQISTVRCRASIAYANATSFSLPNSG